MGYRNILIQNPKRLRVKNNRLAIHQIDTGEKEVEIPLEDISSIVIEDRACTLSSFLISECSRFGISLFTCDQKHLPVSIILPFQNHSRQSKRILVQIGQKVSFKKNIWKILLKQKIFNQSWVLKEYHKGGYLYLNELLKQVKPGDPYQIEGIAAGRYFKELFGIYFSRSQDIDINTYLDYTYAIVRGSIARSIASYGLLPAFGIHHKNEYNNFNLADDFIEPFRPIVDHFILGSGVLECGFKVGKKKLQLVLEMEVIFNQKVFALSNTVDECIKSYVSAIEKKDYTLLKVPIPTTVNIHKYE